MKKILVPCDFSKPAIHAFRFALDIASQSKGIVHLLHVVELPVMHDTVLMPVLNFEEEMLNNIQKNAEKRFKRIIDKYAAGGVKVAFKTQFGVVSKMIRDYTEAESIDLVLMGSHGVTGARELFIGSNTQKIVRNSLVPVLVTKNLFKGPVKNIVFPNSLDDENQEELVMKVKALQAFFNAHLHVVRINTPLNFLSDTITKQRLEVFAKRYRMKDYTISIFNHTDEEGGILEFVKSSHGDLIAIGTHGRKGFSNLINGSLAEDLVNHTKSLVWTFSSNNNAAEK